MRTWYKYIFNNHDDRKYIRQDALPAQHKQSMGGYSIEEGYGSQEEFFKRYFYDVPNHYKYYHQYLAGHLEKSKKGLSIGSGRCVNELLLIRDGFQIICSDLEHYCKEGTSRIFPDLEFCEFDITKGPFREKVDYVISLGVLFLFDEEQLIRVFAHVAESLKPGGVFIVDPGGAQDSPFVYLIDEMFCRMEGLVKSGLRRNGSPGRLARKHHGFRSKNKEIIAVAEKAGFKLQELSCFDDTTEWNRSWAMRKLPDSLKTSIGKNIPYVRLFNFLKKSSVFAPTNGGATHEQT